MSPAASASRRKLLAGLEDGGVVVRMYRPGGLGDCFLLAFPPAEEPRFVLVDCGVFNGTSGGAERMREVAADVAEVTGGRLDALVATHEHWDHLSGFRWAQEVFDELEVDEVWVAWTEDRSDPLANELREGRRRTARALVASVARLRQEEEEEPGSGTGEAAAVGEVLGFALGLDDEGRPDLLAAASPGTAKQMEYVCQRWGTPRYLRPGTALPWGDDFRVYVLGPPEDRELLQRSDPSAAHSEVYEGAPAMNGANAFGIAVLAAADEKLTPGEEDFLERSQPFEARHGIALDDLRERPGEAPFGDFFSERYGFGPDGKGAGEDGGGGDGENAAPGPRWRRIGGSWLSAAGQLALQLDSDTNNTSLALAFEHRATGKVLLFPADAQVGNWLSWHRHRWPREAADGGAADGGAGSGDDPVTADELLARTVVYKVGHHGSHNATLRDGGLEKMTHPELVALVPVDEAQAATKRWAMPFGPLYDRLRERCGERILRADRGLPERPGNVPEADWRRFAERTAKSRLWVQYSVPLPARTE